MLAAAIIFGGNSCHEQGSPRQIRRKYIQLRKVVVKQLSSLGHGVQEADSAAAALTILQGNKPLDLLFTDVVMPGGITGTALAHEAQKLRPGIKILLTSGFTEAAAQNCGELELLSKPYRLQDLDRKIRGALGRA